jgi:hypothetical protein
LGVTACDEQINLPLEKWRCENKEKFAHGLVCVFSPFRGLSVGAALALPPPVAFAAPVVHAVAVSAGGGSYAGVLGGAV